MSRRQQVAYVLGPHRSTAGIGPASTALKEPDLDRTRRVNPQPHQDQRPHRVIDSAQATFMPHTGYDPTQPLSAPPRLPHVDVGKLSHGRLGLGCLTMQHENDRVANPISSCLRQEPGSDGLTIILSANRASMTEGLPQELMRNVLAHPGLARQDVPNPECKPGWPWVIEAVESGLGVPARGNRRSPRIVAQPWQHLAGGAGCA